MKTLLALGCSLVLVLSACGTRETTNSNQARVRNQPPAACTEADFQACPEIAFERCADGQEPVIDYSSDCCPHFSCQTQCTPEVPCPMGPAPACPPGSQLVITTATDCCPAYRCEASINCDGTEPFACPAAFPWCGEGVEPIIVGYNDGCCPIYQCPCDVPVAGGGTLPDDAPRSDPGLCGCTFPACAPGQQLQCWGDNICGYPCECVPVQAECVTDADCPQYDCDPMTDCGVQLRCDTSMCLPMPGCDPSTGEPCPAVCGGICVGGTTIGCKADVECPVGQRCEMMCAGWACANDPTFPGCECPPDLPCTCDENGCYGEECSGQCVPAPVCGGTCAAPRCPDAIEIGIDECGCPLFECGSCQPNGAPCAMPDCQGAVAVGTDPNCCPIFCCPDGTGSCPTPEPRPL